MTFTVVPPCYDSKPTFLVKPTEKKSRLDMSWVRKETSSNERLPASECSQSNQLQLEADN